MGFFYFKFEQVKVEPNIISAKRQISNSNFDSSNNESDQISYRSINSYFITQGVY